MLFYLVTSSLVTVLTIAIAAGFIGVAIHALKRFEAWLSPPTPIWRIGVALSLTTLWLLAALTIAVWIWGFTYLALGAFDAIEPALYFSIVAFTTVGFGDVVLEPPLRITAGVCAASGVLLFGLCTAFLVGLFRALVTPERAESDSES